MTRSRRGRVLLALLAIATVGIALRAGPLWQTPLPFNPDGIIHAVHAQQTRVMGHMPLAALGTDDLLFTSWVTTIAEITGHHPLTIAQPAIAVVGTIPALVAVALTWRLGRTLGWQRHRWQAAGLLAGALLAVEGLYLHRSMAVDEQTLGLLFVPVLVYVAARSLATGRRGWLSLAVVCIVALPATHNLDTVVAAIALTGSAAMLLLGGLPSRRYRLGLGLAGGTWAFAVVYTVGVAVLTTASINQSGRLLTYPGLFVAWLVVYGALLIRAGGSSPRWQRGLALAPFALLTALAVVNVFVPLFPFLDRLHPTLFMLGFPLVGLAMLAAWGVPWASRSGTEGPLVLALLGAPLVLVGLSLTATLTPEYAGTVYRSSTFLHFPAVILIGLTVGTLIESLSGHARTLPGQGDRQATVPGRRGRGDVGISGGRMIAGVVVVLVLLAAAVSIPIAFGGLSVLNYKGVTTPAEYDAATFAQAYTEGGWASDNHLVRITWAGEDRTEAPNASETASAGTWRPTFDWLVGDGLPPSCPTVVQQSWTTVGAQMFPRPPASIDDARLRGWLTRNDLVYRSGEAADPISLVVPSGDGTGGC